MRTSEERVWELHRRMAVLEQEKSRRRYRLGTAVISAGCLAITLVLALLIAQAPVQVPGMGTGSMTASIFTDHAVLGYVVVAFLAFCLGTLAAIFCFRLKQQEEEKQKQREKQDREDG